MPTVFDLLFLVLVFVFLTVFETRVFIPRFKAEVAAGVPGARTRAYRRTLAGQWAVSLVVLGAWLATGRSWSALALVPSGGWHLVVALAFIVVALWFGIVQTRGINRIGAGEEKRARYRERLSALSYMLPGDDLEFRWFVALSITAGICEELLCRGYMVWVLRAYIGLAAAVAVSVVAFGLGHFYQGKQGVMKTGLVGLVMNAIVLLSGGLLPAMLIHALIDATAGYLAYVVFRDGQREVLNPAA